MRCASNTWISTAAGSADVALLTVLITHLPAEAVEANVRHLERVAPGARVLVCHGGRREDFEQITRPHKLFVEDPDLRAPPITIQSYNEIVRRVWEEGVRDEPAIEAVYILEYDQVVLRSDYERVVLGVLALTGADFVGKNCVDRTRTNWVHYLRFREDPGLLAFLRRISVRDDHERMFGCLGTGLLMRRAVVSALATMEHYRPAYNELYLPTVVHHLGFRVDDISRVTDLYAHVRWLPAYELTEALRLQAAGAVFVHPFKDWRALPVLEAAALSPSAPPSAGDASSVPQTSAGNSAMGMR